MFWKPGLPPFWKAHECSRVNSESNETITTCSCNHLTVFAALMDPYGVRVSASPSNFRLCCVFNNNNNNNNLFAPFCTKKIQIELNEYISDWASEITMGANLVGCPLYKVLICKTNNQRYMEEKQ